MTTTDDYTMERSMKCSVRRQYGALVEGLQVMESFLAEGRAKRTIQRKLPRPAAYSFVQRPGIVPRGTNSRMVSVGVANANDCEKCAIEQQAEKQIEQHHEHANLQGDASNAAADGDVIDLGDSDGNIKDPSQARLEENARPPSPTSAAAPGELLQSAGKHVSFPPEREPPPPPTDTSGVNNSPRVDLRGSSIPEFIRTRHPLTARPETIYGQTENASYADCSRIDISGSGLAMLHSAGNKMFVPASTHVVDSRHHHLNHQQRNLAGVNCTRNGLFGLPMDRLPIIAQEEGDEWGEDEDVTNRSVRQSRPCSSVGRSSVRSRRQSVSSSVHTAPAASRVYPKSPGEHHPPKTAPIVSLKPPFSDHPDTERFKFKMAINGLLVDTSRAAPLVATSRTSLTTRTPRSHHPPPVGGATQWRINQQQQQHANRDSSISADNARQSTQKENVPNTTTTSSSSYHGINRDKVAVEAVSLSNLPPPATTDNNVFIKKHGAVDALRSYLRIIPPGFQMPPGADGATPRSRMENYAKLGSDKRIYVTFCQSLAAMPQQPPITPRNQSGGSSANGGGGGGGGGVGVGASSSVSSRGYSGSGGSGGKRHHGHNSTKHMTSPTEETAARLLRLQPIRIP